MVYILISSLFGSIIGYLIIRKKKETQHNFSFAFKIFTFLWTNILCLLLFFILPELLENSYAYLFYPKYVSEIVDVESGYEEMAKGSGQTQSRLLMHTPIVRFKLEDGPEYIEMPLDIKSTEKPQLGNTIEVAYKNQSIYQLTNKGYLFLLGETLLVIMFFYPLLHSVFYVTGKDTTMLKTIAVRSAIYIAVLMMIIFVVFIFRAMID